MLCIEQMVVGKGLGRKPDPTVTGEKCGGFGDVVAGEMEKSG